MKYFFVFILFYSGQILAQSGIYGFDVQTDKGNTISLSAYKGKKMLIAVIGTDVLQKKDAISYLDSLQTSNPKVAVIVIPANDVNDTLANAATVNTLQTASDKVIVAGIVAARKDKASNQNPLLQWLTHADKNGHFNADVETDNQLYLISESGVLYAVLGKGLSCKAVNEVLKQADIKQ